MVHIFSTSVTFRCYHIRQVGVNGAENVAQVFGVLQEGAQARQILLHAPEKGLITLIKERD
jgi:hypothetical protein